ncbi:uncharacterized protein LOC110704207 [Chenopodium quinoa]|uniref:uncharacterized protein LOC110704207 n=1 Tax=Chenopodium quinoa TaxID=63459 RepID=UPI000B777D62|nr:uncharacterized protein LOC110704207 [Chenopodium quinoa]
MPSGRLFCDVCKSYDQDASNCPRACMDVCDDQDGNVNEHVNYVSNNNDSTFENKRSLDPKRLVNAIVTRSGKVLEESFHRKSEIKEATKEVLVEDERDGASFSEVKIEKPSECNYNEQDATKLKDPGNFSIPCAIYKMKIDNGLCDLGASVSLMPYLVYQRLEIGELFPTNITLQLVDRSIKFPKGKLEDVPLRVGKFVILVDFVVLEMDEDSSVFSIFLGRLFLATSGYMIDVKSAKISIKLEDEVIEFNLNDSIKYPSSSLENCMLIDSLDHVSAKLKSCLVF